MVNSINIFVFFFYYESYPNWYRALCDNGKDGIIGPTEITTSSQVVPKLLKLTWDGFPLFHCRELGWGYLVPGRPMDSSQGDKALVAQFPLQQALSLFPPRPANRSEISEGLVTAEDIFPQLRSISDKMADPTELANQWIVCLP